MKFTPLSLLGLIVAVIFAFCLAVVSPPSARAQSADNPLEYSTSLTTSTLSLTSSAYQEFDMVTCLGQSSTWVSNAITAKSVVLRIRALTNDSTSSTTRAQFKWFTSDPTSASLDASTPAKSGVCIQEGDEIYTVMTGRYLAVYGENQTSLLKIERVK